MLCDRSNSRRAGAFFTLAVFAAGCVVAGLTVAASPSAAQDQTSLGDAARKVRADKKNEQAPKTFTNDNLPKTDAGVSVVGQAPAASAAAPAATPGTPAAPAASDDKSGAAAVPAAAPMSPAMMAVQHELDDAMKAKDQLEKEIDLSQRDYSLQEQQALQNPRFATDHDAQAHMSELRQGIDDQKTQLDTIKTHIADLQKKLEEMNKGPEPGSK